VLLYLEQMSGNIGHLDVELRLSNQQIDLLSRQTGIAVLSGGRAPWTGRQLLTAEFVGPTGSQSFSFPVDVLDTTPVVVAKRGLARGQTITASDVELQVPTREMRMAPSRAVLRQIEEAVGLESGRAIRPGEVLSADLCLAPLMIERNQIVTVTIAGGGFELSRQAKAIAPARLGEFTEVQLLNSKERLAARVVGPGKLAIADTAPSAPAQATPPRQRKYQP
jgi:flagella basal body P-ring formation protein FlgA